MTTQREPNPEMGARAKARREALGIEKNQLAVTLGCGTTRISAMEKDGVENLSRIVEWANALDMNPVYLAFGKGKVSR